MFNLFAVNNNVHTNDTNVEERKEKVHKALQKFPERIPLFLERGTQQTPQIDKNKFLVPNNLRVSDIYSLVRKRIQIKSPLAGEQGIFLFFNNMVVNPNLLLSEVYEQYKNKDDEMLYCLYTIENTFG